VNHYKAVTVIEELAPQINQTGDPKGTLIKYANDHNLAPAELERLCQVFNTAKTLTFMKKSASNRGGSFSILDVDDVVNGYTTYTPPSGSIKSASVPSPKHNVYKIPNLKEILGEKETVKVASSFDESQFVPEHDVRVGLIEMIKQAEALDAEAEEKMMLDGLSDYIQSKTEEAWGVMKKLAFSFCNEPEFYGQLHLDSASRPDGNKPALAQLKNWMETYEPMVPIQEPDAVKMASVKITRDNTGLLGQVDKLNEILSSIQSAQYMVKEADGKREIKSPERRKTKPKLEDLPRKTVDLGKPLDTDIPDPEPTDTPPETPGGEPADDDLKDFSQIPGGTPGGETGPKKKNRRGWFSSPEEEQAHEQEKERIRTQAQAERLAAKQKADQDREDAKAQREEARAEAQARAALRDHLVDLRAVSPGQAGAFEPDADLDNLTNAEKLRIRAREAQNLINSEKARIQADATTQKERAQAAEREAAETARRNQEYEAAELTYGRERMMQNDPYRVDQAYYQEDPADKSDFKDLENKADSVMGWLDKKTDAPYNWLKAQLGSTPGRHVAQERQDKTLRELAAAVTLQKAIMTDPSLSEADPDRVVSLYNSLYQANPELMSDPNLALYTLREAVQYDGVTPHTYQQLADIDKGVAQTAKTKKELEDQKYRLGSKA
jgi:hypothetical protein